MLLYNVIFSTLKSKEIELFVDPAKSGGAINSSNMGEQALNKKGRPTMADKPPKPPKPTPAQTAYEKFVASLVEDVVGPAITSRNEDAASHRAHVAAEALVLQEQNGRLRQEAEARRQTDEAAENARRAAIDAQLAQFQQAQAARDRSWHNLKVAVIAVIMAALVATVIYLLVRPSPAPVNGPVPVSPVAFTAPAPSLAPAPMAAPPEVDAYGLRLHPTDLGHCMPQIDRTPMLAGIACCNRIPDLDMASACRAQVDAHAR